ncbi:hypothetical protein VTK26DRAFT_8379 [Humicola hyalothermophila]
MSGQPVGMCHIPVPKTPSTGFYERKTVMYHVSLYLYPIVTVERCSAGAPQASVLEQFGAMSTVLLTHPNGEDLCPGISVDRAVRLNREVPGSSPASPLRCRFTLSTLKPGATWVDVRSLTYPSSKANPRSPVMPSVIDLAWGPALLLRPRTTKQLCHSFFSAWRFQSWSFRAEAGIISRRARA